MRMLLRCALILCASAIVAEAHEFWLEPASYRPPPNSVVRISSRLGERFAGQQVLYDGDHFEKFEMTGPAGDGPVLGRSGRLTAFGRVASAGTYVLGYRSNRYAHEMEPQQFEAYLKEEGLEWIADARKQLGETNKAGREAYSRYAKSILTVGKGSNDGFGRRLGHPLEIVPEHDPVSLRANAKISIQLLYKGKPLADATVVAVSRNTPDRRFTAVTSTDGRASFTLAQTGVWMITSIHMIRTTSDLRADWESFWASLTFEVPAQMVDSATPAQPEPDHSRNAMRE